MLVKQAVHLLLCAPFLAGNAAEQIGVGYVRFVGRIIQAFVKHHLELVGKFLFASHKLYQAINIMRHEEGVVPCASFVESGHLLEVFALTGVERGQECAVLIERTQGAALLRVVVAVAGGTRAEFLGKFLVAALFCQPCEGIVGYIILQRVRYGVVA